MRPGTGSGARPVQRPPNSPAPARGGTREAEVWARLATVTDPELDEPVTDLGFVEEVSIGPDGAVTIGFRLPTWWCAANFAWLMADDMRCAVGGLPWVKRVLPRLRDHMFADRVNDGVARGLSFGAAFGEEADESLEGLRATFARKAFQRRQEAVLRALLQQGLSAPALVAMTLADLDRVAIAGPDGTARKARYRESRAAFGGPAGPEDRAFVAVCGAALTVEGFDAHLRALASVRTAMEFNGALCRGLLAARDRAAASPRPPAAALRPDPEPDRDRR